MEALGLQIIHHSIFPMVFIRVPKSWQLPNHGVTPEAVFFNRRRFLKTATGFSIGAATSTLVGCKRAYSSGDKSDDKSENRVVEPDLAATLETQKLSPFRKNPDFLGKDLAITEPDLAGQFNNFYEFGGNKYIWKAAQKLPTDDWKEEVTGLVKNPRTYDLDDLYQKFPLEERVYRFRCVEAWAMVVPWLGFPMRLLMEEVEPTGKATFVEFASFYDPEITKGPSFPGGGNLPWPYREGLRIDEMANDLAFFAVGVYGKALPKQHGAPIRMVVPWKYGFKGGKSVVKITFTDQQPATFWNTLSPNEYGFESNVDPTVPHPRWSQAKERVIGPGSFPYGWEQQPTLPYNGYEEYVGDLYT